MEKKRYYFILALGVFLFTSVNTYADGRKNAYTPAGIHLGAFLLHPIMTFANEYDSNIFQRDRRIGETASYIAHFMPGFTIDSEWNQHALYFSLNTDLAIYSTQPEFNDYNDVFISLGGYFDILKNSVFDARFGYDKLHQQRGSPDQSLSNEQVFFDIKSLNLLYNHKFNRLALEPSFDFVRYDYQDTPTVLGTGLQQSTRDRWEFTTSIQMGYEIQPGYQAFSRFIWKEIDYDTAVSSSFSTTRILRDSTGFNFLVGMDFNLTHLLIGDISVGYLYRKYENINFATISGPNGFINLIWNPTPLAEIVFNYSHDIGETTQRGVAGILIDSASINITHELLRNVILILGGEYTHNEYIGFNANTPIAANRTNRIDNIFGVNTGVRYLLNRNFSMELSYEYESRDVNYILQDYDAHSVMLSITGQI